ncbi:hypothetical protein SSBR45G_21030 [Bradyrhizobium sp. SSBR45G]|nr:hypothetical protein SSBR45G_21030 [Bradyrhizobium sp. SSBR45G]GLH83953.1 hypothetical protein SSBR45R_14130 [Bradyrhizobium sp. SSBR45R]
MRLESALGKGVSAGDEEAAEAIRDLVETMTVSRDDTGPGGVCVEIAGRLNSLIGGEACPSRVKGVQVTRGSGGIHASPPPPGDLSIIIQEAAKINKIK